MRILIIILAVGILSSCQLKPTKTSNQTQLPESGFAGAEGKLKKALSKNAVILDVRTPLDFSVSRAPRAINVQWEDFSRTGGSERGWLLDDDFAIARRLSLWGIDTDTPVVVLGYGSKGFGEEGRIAWMLKYLGVKDVQFAHWAQVRSTIPREEGKPENKPIWKPTTRAEYLATWEEFQNNILSGTKYSSKARSKALQAPSGAIGAEYVVLDVTDKAALSEVLPTNVSIKKIFWKDFINYQGFPDDEAKKKLEQNGITKNKTIYVISENGLSSALVTNILREWDYSAENFAGGFDYLRKEMKR